MNDTIPTSLFEGRYWNEVISITEGAAAHRLGSGGLFVATSEVPAAGSLLDFELAIGGGAPVVGVVEVVEVRAAAGATGERPAGMRVKFVHLADPAHAREVLERAVVQPTASMSPPALTAAATSEDGPRSAPGAVWDRVALEMDFFDRADIAPVSVSDDAEADALEQQRAQPTFIARQQRLRRTFGAVVAGATLLFAATAVRGVAAPDGERVVVPASFEAPATPAAAAAVPAAAPAPAATALEATVAAPRTSADAPAPGPIVSSEPAPPSVSAPARSAPPGKPGHASTRAPARVPPARPRPKVRSVSASGTDSIYE